jgi:hypothetical protein
MPAQILYQKWKHYFLGPKDLPKLLIQKAKVRGFGFFENLHKSWNSGVIRYEAKFFWDKGVPRECIGGPEYWNDPDRWNDDVWKEASEIVDTDHLLGLLAWYTGLPKDSFEEVEIHEL